MQLTDHELVMGYQLDYRVLVDEKKLQERRDDGKHTGRFMVFDTIGHKRIRFAKSAGHASELVAAMSSP